jgi:zinc protease
MADLTFRALAYPSGHPYGRSGEGYKETIQALSRDDLVNFYRRYRPQGMAVAVVGAIDTGSAIERIEKMLGGWHNDVVKPPAMELPPLPKLTEARRQVVTIPGKTQFDIVLGAPAIARTDPDFMPTLLANTVFGVFGMMGRLGKNVRDEQGLAYYVYSRLEVSVWPGPWVAAAGVNPANVDRALDSILAEMRRMRETIVPKDELADSQSYLTGSMPLRLETNEGVASALLDIEFYDLGLDYLQRYPELVQAVMPEQVQAVAQKYLQPDTYALAIAGPEEGSGA